MKHGPSRLSSAHCLSHKRGSKQTSNDPGSCGVSPCVKWQMWVQGQEEARRSENDGQVSGNIQKASGDLMRIDWVMKSWERRGCTEESVGMNLTLTSMGGNRQGEEDCLAMGTFRRLSVPRGGPRLVSSTFWHRLTPWCRRRRQGETLKDQRRLDGCQRERRWST